MDRGQRVGAVVVVVVVLAITLAITIFNSVKLHIFSDFTPIFSIFDSLIGLKIQ